LAEFQSEHEEVRVLGEQLLATRAELEESCRRYADLFENAPVGYLMLDYQGILKEANRTAAEMVGDTPATMQGFPMRAWVAKSSRSRFLDHMRLCRQSSTRVETDLEIKRRDNRALFVRLSSDCRWATATGVYRTAVLDITQQYQAVAALRESQQQLRRAERLASIGTLAAGIAHEINNPLNSIHMLAEYALTDGEGPGPGATLRSILDETKRCARIVHSLLSFAREQQSPPEVGDLSEVVREVARQAMADQSLGGLQLSLDLAEMLPSVRINRTAIERALLNLVRNARQAAKGPVRVRLATRYSNESVRLTVEDDGPGIPTECLQHIFDPFYSTRQHEGGTGLGLSICHRIIQDHGGSVDVSSASGKGATFTILLPVDDKPRREAS
jgi:PAS domain S-box-containing protein